MTIVHLRVDSEIARRIQELGGGRHLAPFFRNMLKQALDNGDLGERDFLEQHHRSLVLRLTEAEWVALAQQAEAKRLRVGEWVMAMLRSRLFEQVHVGGREKRDMKRLTQSLRDLVVELRNSSSDPELADRADRELNRVRHFLDDNASYWHARTD